ncbi:putative Maltose permease MAL31 (putative) [Pseudozyma hubeiensis]|nr:putative Maltose permease MAL31 (putative) [Pseudozyma hubeiensis]
MSSMVHKDDGSAEKFDTEAGPTLVMTVTELNEGALESKQKEVNASIWESVQACKMGIFWCFCVSLCVIMEGYDLNLLGNFFAFPTFARRYGHYINEEAGYQLTPAWQAGLNNGSGVGAFFGTLLNGILVTRFGHRAVLVVALTALSCFIFITFFAKSVEMLLIGQLLCGVPWGVFATTAPAYASEVLPLNLRVYMTSWTNMCFIIGQLIASGVLAGLVNLDSEWGYRIPFALQWIWPAFLIPVLFFAPDSPWHLVRQGRPEDAERSLRRLYSKNVSDNHIKDTLAAITKTNELEQQMSVGTSYRDCFKGHERRRTEIACMVFAGQVLSGSSFAYNSTYFFQQVGLNADQTYHLNVGGTGMALVGTLCSWFFVMPFVGRRRTYISGMAAMAAVLMIIGILNTHTSNDSVGMAQAVLTLVWTFIFQLSVGQLGWAIPAEIGSTRLRQKTICLARNAYYIVSVISQVLQPYFMNPSAWNLKGYTGFFWGGTAVLTFAWAFFRLPESKNRSFDEIDMLFAQGVSARKFKSTHVDTSLPKEGDDLPALSH